MVSKPPKIGGAFRALFLSVVALFIAISVSSCQKEENIKQKDAVNHEALMSSPLVRELKAFNDSLINSQIVQTRGFWSTLGKICAIAGADATGAWECGKIGAEIGEFFGPQGWLIATGTGALIGAIGGSFLAGRGCKSVGTVSNKDVVAAYATLVEKNVNIHEFYPKYIKLNLPEDKVILQDIGAKHNIALDNLRNGELSSIPATKALSSTEIEVVFSPKYEEKYYQILDRCASGDVNAYMSNPETISDVVMKLYLNILVCYPQQLKDVEFITNSYVGKIAKSVDLPDTDKDMLYSALSVAVSSTEYWQQEMI